MQYRLLFAVIFLSVLSLPEAYADEVSYQLGISEEARSIEFPGEMMPQKEACWTPYMLNVLSRRKPSISIRNTTPAYLNKSIVRLKLTLAKPSFAFDQYWDYVAPYDYLTDFQERTLVSPDTIQGGVVSKTLDVSFSARPIRSGEQYSFRVLISQADGQPAIVDYKDVFWDRYGNQRNDNLKVEVSFSDGTVLPLQIWEFGTQNQVFEDYYTAWGQSWIWYCKDKFDGDVGTFIIKQEKAKPAPTPTATPVAPSKTPPPYYPKSTPTPPPYPTSPPIDPQDKNEPPVCDASAKAQEYTSDCHGEITTIDLDGSDSYDPEGTKLSYIWSTDCPGQIQNTLGKVTKIILSDPYFGKDVSCNVKLSVSDGRAVKDCSAPLKVKPCLAECTETKIQDRQSLIDAASLRTAALVKKLASKIEKLGSESDKTKAKSLKATAEKLHSEIWTSIWSLSSTIITCTNSRSCTQSDNSAALNKVSTNAEKLNRLTKQAIVILKKITKKVSESANIAKRADELLTQSKIEVSAIPAISNTCN